MYQEEAKEQQRESLATDLYFLKSNNTETKQKDINI